MDPLAHTLVGASLAEAGLRRTTRLATPALLIGANLPDIDAVTSFVDANLMFGFRRGWTHGILAMVALPWLLTGFLLLFARLRPDSTSDPPLRPPRLAAVAHLAVWSHPCLDWLNNYGVRLLMPFDDTWFYGDAIFIVDPWMWLATASAVVLARTQHRLALGAWTALGVVTSYLVLTAPGVPPLARGAWCGFVAALCVARAAPRPIERAPRTARVALAALAVYLLANVAGTAVARAQVRAWLAARGEHPTRIVAGPIAANPLQRDVVVLADGTYRFLRLDWLGDQLVAPSDPPLAVNDGPLARTALAAPGLEGFARWLRLPAFTLEPIPDGTRVVIRDVRYSRFGASFGHATVDLDAAGRSIRVRVGD